MIHMIHTIVEWTAIAVDVIASVIMVWAFLVSVFTHRILKLLGSRLSLPSVKFHNYHEEIESCPFESFN